MEDKNCVCPTGGDCSCEDKASTEKECKECKECCKGDECKECCKSEDISDKKCCGE